MKQFIHKRYKSAKEQLLNPKERPADTQRPSRHDPPRAIMQRLEKSVRKAEDLQRKLHEIQRTMQAIHRSLQRQDYREAENLLEAMERLTENESTSHRDR